jgi:hypothetical protein
MVGREDPPMHRSLLACLVSLALGAAVALPAPADAAAIVTWSFDETNVTASPDQSLTIVATVSNSPAATDDLSFIHIAAVPGSGPAVGGTPLAAAYTVDFIETFFVVPETLAPGESFQFGWVALVPIGGYAPPGTYGPAGIGIGTEFDGAFHEGANVFQVTVIPEPGSGALLAFGVLALCAFRPRRTPLRV